MPQRRRLLGIVCLALLFVVSSTPPAAIAAGPTQWDKIDPALASALRAHPASMFPVIVEVGPVSGQVSVRHGAARAQEALDHIRAVGGKSKNSLSIIGAGTGDLDADGIASLSRNPRVRRLSLDRPVPAADIGSPGIASIYTQLVRAPDVWKLGYTGAGIGVAVVDSGVFANADLAGRLTACGDFISPQSTCGTDPGGHGTHVAGVVAGDGTSSASNLGGAYEGIAPNANIISVRVIDANGSAPISAVIKGIQWVVNNRKLYNIRVMNLSFGAPAVTSYKDDPMVTASEVAWLSGVVVVAAAGNTGPAAGTINTPALDPFSLAVGALDDNMTLDPSDDTIASFSSRGPTIDNVSKPDLVAPGRRIISLFDPGAYLDTTLLDRITTTTNGATYFRLSGTSQAAPVVSGVAALLLQRNPNLRPDQVKWILKNSARSLSGMDANSAGKGMVDAYAAVTSSLVDRDNRGGRPSDGFAFAILPLIKGTQPLVWKDPNYGGRNWLNLTWDNLTWDNLTWDNLTWDNLTWDNLAWENLTWDNLTWNTSWSSTSWDSIPWASAVDQN